MKTKVCIGLFVAVAVNVVASLSAHAATIPVTVATETGLPTDCTLANAVQAANTNLAVNGCPAGDPSPTRDTIQLEAATYDLTAYVTPTVMNLTESARLVGQGRTQTFLVQTYDSLVNFAPDVLQSAPQQYELSGLTLTGTMLATFYGVSHSTLVATDFGIANGSLTIDGQDTAQAEATVDEARLEQGHIYVGQRNGSHLRVTLKNIYATRHDSAQSNTIQLQTDSTNPGDITIEDSTLDATGYTGLQGGAIGNTNPNGNNTVSIRNTNIVSYPIAIQHRECPYFVIYSLVIENSSIGGDGMSKGVVVECGHLSVKNTTFHDINGSAISMITNTNALGTTYSSHVEVTNSTFTGITPTLVDGKYGQGIIDIITNLTDPLPNTSSLSLIHNTFAGNTLGSYPVISLTDGTVLGNLTLKNNAIEGLPLDGSHTLSGTATVAHNLTTASYAGDYASGFKTVSGFVLGALIDNGGTAPIGYHGADGHVLTMRPHYGSPLIDDAPSAGLTSDQRGGPRSVLGAYDVGAVEVSLAEYTADGGVWGAVSTLANTGANLYTMIGVGLACMAAGALVLRRVVHRHTTA